MPTLTTESADSTTKFATSSAIKNSDKEQKQKMSDTPGFGEEENPQLASISTFSEDVFCEVKKRVQFDPIILDESILNQLLHKGVHIGCSTAKPLAKNEFRNNRRDDFGSRSNNAHGPFANGISPTSNDYSDEEPPEWYREDEKSDDLSGNELQSFDIAKMINEVNLAPPVTFTSKTNVRTFNQFSQSNNSQNQKNLRSHNYRSKGAFNNNYWQIKENRNNNNINSHFKNNGERYNRSKVSFDSNISRKFSSLTASSNATKNNLSEANQWGSPMELFGADLILNQRKHVAPMNNEVPESYNHGNPLLKTNNSPHDKMSPTVKQLFSPAQSSETFSNCKSNQQLSTADIFNSNRLNSYSQNRKVPRNFPKPKQNITSLFDLSNNKATENANPKPNAVTRNQKQSQFERNNTVCRNNDLFW